MSREALPKRKVAELKGHEGAVLTALWNYDGQYCLTGGKDRTIKLWSPVRELCIKTYTGHGQEVRSVASTKDNAKLASCGGDKQVFYWDVSTGRTIRRFRGHDLDCNSIIFAAHDSVIFTAGYDQTVRAWDCRSQSIDPIQIMDGFKDSVTSVKVADNSIIAGSVDGTIHTFDIRFGRETVDDLELPITSLSLSNDSKCLLAGCLESVLRLVDCESGEELQHYLGLRNKASFKLATAFTTSDAHVVGGSENGEILFWDLVEGDVVSRFQAHSKVVCAIDFHPVDACMLTSSADGTAKLWK